MSWPDPSELGVAAWKRLIAEHDGKVPPRVAEALAADPREGLQALARSLERGRKARRRESDRLRRLLQLERELWGRGVELVAGVDEAGMGPLAGPIVAAAVILRRGQRFEGLDDSKQLDRAQRESLAGRVRAESLAVGVGRASVADIAERDVYQAGLLAMRRAVEALDPRPQHLLVDARTIPGISIPQDGHVKGDARSLSIAAASVVAKTTRDAEMCELDRRYPGYGFAQHQGYGTEAHVEALKRLGPCPEHRSSWDAVAEHAGDWSADYYRLRESLEEVASEAAMADWRRESGRRAGGLRPNELRRLEALAAKRDSKLERAAPPVSGALPFD